MEIKVLSVRQPWAHLIINGGTWPGPHDNLAFYKTGENRTWRTRHRGRLYIHASQGYKKTFHEVLTDKIYDDYGVLIPAIKNMQFGEIIGYIDLVDCLEKTDINKDSYHYDNPWHWNDANPGFLWTLRNPIVITPIKAKGKLGIWTHKIED